MPEISYLAWRVGRNFTTTWHLCRNAKWTLCGRKPDGLLSVWRGKKPPEVTQQCRVCRTYEARELRNR